MLKYFSIETKPKCEWQLAKVTIISRDLRHSVFLLKKGIRKNDDFESQPF